MLPSIKDRSSLNLITDSSNNFYTTLGLIKKLIHSEKDVVLLCYHMSPRFYQSKFKLDLERVLYYDGFHDPLSWNDDKDTRSDNSSKTPYEAVTKIVKDFKLDDATVVIDDLVLFGRSVGVIDHNGVWEGMFHLLHDLSEDYRLFYFVNRLVTNEYHVQALKHVSSYQLNISCCHHSSSYQCEYVLKKKSGKVSREVFTASLQELDFIVSKQTNVVTDTNAAQSDNNVDPTSNLTFNLRLTESEKQARANTVLPYLLTETDKASQLKKSTAMGGHVIYTPDESDDFDDEDPDDDLDI